MSEMKQVIVIRVDLDLSGGKAVAQGAHACLGSMSDTKGRWGPIGGDMIEPWNETGKTKICLAVHSEEELLALDAACEAANLGHYLVRDAGRTEVAPSTPTALGIGPDSCRRIDKLTSHLSLY
jgi:peptidyl-tRNA hydrolase, PTH2 family